MKTTYTKRNPKILFSLRLFKGIIDTFIDTFFVLYFLEVSKDNIVPLGIYGIIMVSTIYIVIYLCRNLARSKHRVRLMWVAMALDLVYFFSIIILQERIVQYSYLLGFIYGAEEGFYYSVYNTLESDGVDNKNRTRFVGTYKATKAALAIVFPIILGGLMYATGFVESSIVVVVIVLVRLILSLFYKDKDIPLGKKTDMKRFYQVTRNDKRFRWLNITHFFNGFTSSCSAFSQVITIYTITVFSNSLNLGIFTAVMSGVSGAIGIIFARFLQKKNYNHVIGVSGAATVVAFLVMVFECNIFTIATFRFFRVISKDFTQNINETSNANLCNSVKIKRSLKPEYWINNERFLVMGRILSYILFISMAFMESWMPVMIVFTIGLVAYTISSIRYERVVLRLEKKPIRLGRFLPAFLYVDDDEFD